MVTHRDYVCMAFDNYLSENKLEGKMLDVGCRDTQLKEYFESKGLEWNGVDRSGADKVKEGLMEKLPYDNNTFDLVFCCHAFEHCEKPIDALKEFIRVAKVGGIIFIATPNPCEKQIVNGDFDHIFVLNEMQMCKLLKYVGLKGISYLQDTNIPKLQDYNIITIGVKNE